MRWIWLWIIGAGVVWPIHTTATTVGDKPIDVMGSDLLFIVMPFTYLLARTTPSKSQLQSVTGKVNGYHVTPILAMIFVVYATAIAGVGLGMSGEYVRLFSAFKLAKPVGFVFLGLLLGTWTDPFEFIDIMTRAYGVIVALMLFFTVTGPDFPLGDWGKYIFEFELSGYPNSPMSFIAALVPLLLACADSSRQQTFKLISWGLAGCSALMIVGSMSRSSVLALLCGIVIYLATTGRTAFLGICFAGFVVVSVIGFGLFSIIRETEVVSVLSSRIQDRLERTTGDDDPSSGRYEIWQLAIELWTERPVFGYMFESFSRYSGDVDTPHQQYLEVLHKCGGLGLLIYFGLLVSCLTVIARLLRITRIRSGPWYQMHALRAMLIAILIGNLTQPNLTYSLTGNMVFLVFGCLCSSRTVISVPKPINSPFTKTPRPNPGQLQRAAA